MADYAHNYTDEKLKELEKRFQDIYKQAEKEVSQKFKEYSDEFAKEDDEMQVKLKHGIITDKEYYAWRQKKLMTGKRWQELRDNLAKDYTNANKIAMSAINGYTPDAYAENFNWSTYKAEKDALMDTAFTLYDRQTVERLVRDNPDLLPAPKVDIAKDQRWNKQKITSAITQGILQGESVPKIAKRLQNVGEMNKAAAVRNARTAMTGAQNAGRVNSYERAVEMGIEIEQEWVATLDNRTRHSHAVLDGERIPVGGTFSNGCRYPGDTNAPGYEYWNCRCTLISVRKGKTYERGKYGNGKLGDMSYDQWKEIHRKALEKQGGRKNGKKED